MSVLLDTNILTRLAQVSHPQHKIARNAVEGLNFQKKTLYIVPQNLYEFWSVCTRPIAPNNGLGLTVHQAKLEIERAHSIFKFLPDSSAVYREWERIVVDLQIKGKNSHDARLVAAMRVHGLNEILTFDRDFQRYPDLTMISPDQVANAP